MRWGNGMIRGTNKGRRGEEEEEKYRLRQRAFGTNIGVIIQYDMTRPCKVAANENEEATRQHENTTATLPRNNNRLHIHPTTPCGLVAPVAVHQKHGHQTAASPCGTPRVGR